jgi:hypothetical protein
MTVSITLQLSDNVMEQAQRLGHITQQAVESVLGEALETIGLTWNFYSDDHLPKPIDQLSDQEVLDLAMAKMPPEQHARLGDLQAQGKAASLAESERYELLALLQIYQLGLLRKAVAIAETKRRNLPLELAS